MMLLVHRVEMSHHFVTLSVEHVMCWSCIVHVYIRCRSCVDHVSFMCWSCVDHVSFMCWSGVVHVLIRWLCKCCVTCWTRRCPRCFQTESTPVQDGWTGHTDRWCEPGNPAGGGAQSTGHTLKVNTCHVSVDLQRAHCPCNLITFGLGQHLNRI